MAIELDGKRLCELCYMNPPHDATEDGEITFLPVPEALPGKDYCEDCQQQADDLARAGQRHVRENHQAPWEHNCMICSMHAYGDERERNWQEHLAQCEECRTSPHDFVTEVPRCRNCGAEADKVPPGEVCTDSYTREMHRDMC